MDDPKRSAAAAAAATLPDDALVQILSRVPAKSLCRFKCVSRAWRDLITDRNNRLPQTLEGFFVNGGGGNTDDVIVVGSARVVGRFIDTLGKPSPLASYSFLVKVPGIEEFALLRSCNGLLLLGHRRAGDTYDSLGYIVCNPATEQWVAVPSSGFKPLSLLDEGEASDSDAEIGSAFTFLIFDPAVSSHFRLVEFISDDCVSVEEVQAYSSETGVWCDSDWSSDDRISFFAGSAVVNGMLHLSVTSFDNGNGTRQELILAVDGEGKYCRSLSGPEKGSDVAFVGESQGLVHCVNEHRDCTRQSTELSVWVLQDYDAEEWVLKHSVDFFKLFGRRSRRVEHDYNVVAIHPDRNLIFFVQHWDLKLKSYDMDSKEVRTLCTLGVGRQKMFPLVPYYAELAALANKH